MLAERRGSAEPLAGYALPMTLGTSLVLIAIGAILRYAVTTDVSGIDLQVVGLILMIVGIVGLIISLLYMALWADRSRPRRDYGDDAPHPRDPRYY